MTNRISKYQQKTGKPLMRLKSQGESERLNFHSSKPGETGRHVLLLPQQLHRHLIVKTETRQHSGRYVTQSPSSVRDFLRLVPVT